MSTNLCGDQKTFNKAVRKAINHLDDDDQTQTSTSKLIFTLITLTFYVWALLLALKVEDKQQRVLHSLFALLFGPFYVLAHYVGMMEQNPSSSSSSSPSSKPNSKM
jgi:hypothetical protein